MTGTPGHIELERSIDSIRIGLRHRADLGDIDALAASIERQGLLQPITVTPDGVLVCGARRLAALRQLGVRKLNVWVRAGISDRLTEVLAEQDDNTLHKPLSPTESATLYRELKQLLAEEAARRQEASRFHANGENPRSDGRADSAPPSGGVGRSREQAARLVTGHGSYSRLEQIGDLQRIAGDESTDASVRALAVAELDGIDRGGAVSSAHQRVSAHHSLAELEAIAADLSRPAGVRQASSASAARLHSVERTASAAELEHLAREALARVKAAKKSTNGSHRPADARPTSSSDKTKLPVRAFVFLWGDLHDWWTHYDVAELAASLTDEQWEQFEETLAATIAFAESVRVLRARAGTAAR